ncbi:amidohydrolase [Acidaminococcus timonensis]|uniref:amidohydrolase n=1 Tax=Acidaminococcus timonensis TaxID=1871002 RepID=UPI002942E81F|nr:amidohydrolase [Acidaminococcus timonensis]
MVITDKEALKQKVFSTIDDSEADLRAYAEDVASEPEYGFKEFKTSAKLAAQFDKLGIPYRKGMAVTAVKGFLKGGKPGPTVAILGELDAIGCPDHPKADPDTGAAHACGHHMQQSSMLAAAYGLAKSGVMKELCGNVVFFGVPAEEYIQLAYRKKLRKEGKIHFLCGKGELIYEGEFDDIDMAMMIHSRKKSPEPLVAVGSSSNGFIGKTIQYVGKSAHAADAPDQGINALNAAMLGIMGINALRETFRDQDSVRVHPIITKGGDLVNNVPDDVRIETYVRAKTMEAIDSTNAKVDAALKGGGMAIGAQVNIDTLPGELPLICNKEMNDLFVENARDAFPGVKITDAGHFSASTDMGDVSHLMPAIHPFIGGVDGLLHGPDFKVVDFKSAALMPGKAFAGVIIDLLSDDAKKAKAILKDFKPALTRDQYIAKMDGYFNGEEP